MSEIPYSDINYLNLFSHVGKAATIDLISLDPVGGELKAGSYTFALRYLDSFGTPTNFFTTSQPIAVPFQGSYRRPIGSDGEVRSTRSIRLQIDSIDTNYDRFQLAIIPQYEGVLGTPLLMRPQVILSSTMYAIYGGGEQVTEIALEEILINTASYSKAKSISLVEGSLYLGNLTKHDPLDFQKFANSIKVKTVTKNFTQSVKYSFGTGAKMEIGRDDYGNPKNLTYHSKGFKRGGVYAFYISFILNDGHESPAYHIPGREAVGTEKSVMGPGTYEGVPHAVSGGVAKRFQFESKPHDVLGTGYWENKDEIYPYSEDWEIWEVDENGEGVFTGKTLAGKNVRHHQMPDADEVPYCEGTQDRDIIVLGVDFQNIKIPASIKDRVKAIRFHYAKRDLGNQRVMDQSYLLSCDLNGSPVDNVDASSITNEGLPGPADTYPPNVSGNGALRTMLLHPFNTLRTKQDILSLTHLKGIAQEDWSKFFGIPTRDKFIEVRDRSYLPSYSFPEEGAENSVTRISGGQFYRDFDNTNGEEKIGIFGIAPGRGEEEFPTYLYELCQYKENVFLNFDLQELVYTGFQTRTLNNFDPLWGQQDPPPFPPSFSTGPVFGGDTYIGMWASRHSKWLSEGDDIEVRSRFNLVETYAYPDYRSPGKEVWEEWWPGTLDRLDHFETIVWKDGKPSGNKEGDVFPALVINYNNDYLMNETRKPAIPLPKRRSTVSYFPTRIARGRQDKPDEEIDWLRQFRAEDYIDLPTNRGELTRLVNLNKLLIPHMERSIFRTRGREEIQTADFRAFLGSGDIFEIKPEELYETETGHAGLQTALAGVVTEYGYFFVDQQARKVFHLTPEGLKEVSANGMERFFENNMGYNLEYLGFKQPNARSEYFGVEVAWDPVHKRYLLTKKDIVLIADVFDESDSIQSLEFDVDEQRFIDPEDSNKFLDWGNETYFEQDSFTLSYSPEIQAWISFHDYYADMYFYNSKGLYSVRDSILYKHNNKTQRGRFYIARHDSFLEYVDNRESKVAKTIAGLFIDSEVKDQDGKTVRNRTVTSIQVYNSYQDTGEIITNTEENGNIRKAQGFWRFNQLRNLLDEDGELDSAMEWYDKEWLSDRYHYVKLTYGNSNNNVIHIISSELNIKPSLR